MSRCLFPLLFCFVLIKCDYVNRKICKDVDASQCSVHSVWVNPCTGEPQYCSVRENMRYGLTANITPRFSASYLKVAMFADDNNTDVFDNVVQSPEDGCDYVGCPLVPDSETTLDMKFKFSKLSVGKFPVKVKLWNKMNETQACCFTFKVNNKK